MLPFRIGMGYDVHPLVLGRKMILSGVEIPADFGPDGHSDADVLLHAVADALLGSVAMGDIGQHFPPGDARYKDMDSRLIVKEALRLASDVGYVVGNVDVVVVLQKPKIAAYVPVMREQLASLLEINITEVSIKATTTEKLGFVGRGEGVSSFATLLVVKKD